jgi:hypothetical protein
MGMAVGCTPAAWPAARDLAAGGGDDSAGAGCVSTTGGLKAMADWLRKEGLAMLEWAERRRSAAVAVPGWEESMQSFPLCQRLALMRVGIGSAADTVNLRAGRRNLMTPSNFFAGRARMWGLIWPFFSAKNRKSNYFHSRKMIVWVFKRLRIFDDPVLASKCMDPDFDDSLVAREALDSRDLKTLKRRSCFYKNMS